MNINLQNCFKILNSKFNIKKPFRLNNLKGFMFILCQKLTIVFCPLLFPHNPQFPRPILPFAQAFSLNWSVHFAADFLDLRLGNFYKTH